MKSTIIFIAVTLLYSANHKVTMVADQPIKELQLILDTTQQKLDHFIKLAR